MSKKKNPGTTLATLRLSMGLTQCAVAETVRNMKRCSLSEPHYRRIEKNLVTPSVALAMDIATVLDSDVYEIW
jgi:transcriptional regulator with XRE-family HTH domain